MDELKVKFNRPVSQRFVIPENGYIEDYNHKYNKNINNVIFSNIQISSDLKTNFPDDHTQRLCCVITTGKDKKDAVKNAVSYIEDLQIKFRT